MNPTPRLSYKPKTTAVKDGKVIEMMLGIGTGDKNGARDGYGYGAQE